MNDLLKQLEDECQSHDFFGEYADDFKVWQASFRQKNHIDSLVRKLNNSKEAVEIYNRYAPEQFQI